ncbi:MAG: hypothetical protein MUF14_08110 [Hyphomonadaceae bacterium]|jgi:hypothetical protein|nr:hypothetical protein [Hyphomonadaceae bacterium]
MDRRLRRVALVAGTLALAVGLVGCAPRDEDASSTPGATVKAEAKAPAAPQAAATTDPATPDPTPADAPAAGASIKDDPGARAAIVGSWAHGLESCNSGEAIRFSADGTYGFEGEGGTWDLKGEQLHFENVMLFEPGVDGETPGDPGSVKVVAVEAASMKWQMADGNMIDYVRCPGVQ